MSDFEGQPLAEEIDYMDTLVPVDFVTKDGAERLLMTPDQARNPTLLDALAGTYKRYSFDEVAVHVGYSRSEGGSPDSTDLI